MLVNPFTFRWLPYVGRNGVITFLIIGQLDTILSGHDKYMILRDHDILSDHDRYGEGILITEVCSFCLTPTSVLWLRDISHGHRSHYF